MKSKKLLAKLNQLLGMSDNTEEKHVKKLRKVLKTLTPREEKVLRLRFGIGEKSEHTLEEVGKDFSVTS